MKHALSHFLFGTMALFCLVSAGSAKADETLYNQIVYPGILCVADSSTERGYAIYGDRGIANGDATNAISSAYCPILREQHASGGAGEDILDGLTVYVVDANGGSDVQCQVKLQKTDGSEYMWEDQNSGGANTTAVTTISFGIFDGTAGQGGNTTVGTTLFGSDWHETLACSIPPKSGANSSYILSYVADYNNS